MNDIFYPLLTAIITTGYGMEKALEKYIDKKNSIIHKKLNALLDVEGIEYPKAEDISYKAKKAIKGGDRNKAMELILKETECSNAQALALIEKMEKLNPF